MMCSDSVVCQLIPFSTIPFKVGLAGKLAWDIFPTALIVTSRDRFWNGLWGDSRLLHGSPFAREKGDNGEG
jgi:hypothetical protein